MKAVTKKLILAFILSSFGCAPERNSQIMDSYQISNEDSLASADPANPVTPPPPTMVYPAMKICSKLDVSNITWPKEVGSENWPVYFALALNLTGSFEGREGWKNIANNFDDQGMSLGLMQQNFGQKSLQPLLIKSFQKDNTNMKKLFSSADYQSLKAMLEDFQNSSIATVSSVSDSNSMNLKSQSSAAEKLFSDKAAINELDIESDKSEMAIAQALNVSVAWAEDNLYSGSSFIPRWKKSFQDLAITASYRSLQVDAAKGMFLKAKDYLNYFKFKELRSLLFMFDIVVQNGSFNTEHKNAYNAWLIKNPKSSEQQRLQALLEARLTTVKPQFVNDVRLRKSSIIMGTGTVHGAARNYPKEFCYQHLMKIQ